MDPLSVTASIIAVLQLSAKVLAYLNDVKDASKDRAKCAVEASNVHSLLTNLRFRLEEASADTPWFTAVRALGVENGPLDQFKQALEVLQTRTTDGGRLKKAGEALVWKFKKEEIASILDRIERLKTLVEVALQMDHFKLSQAIKDDTNFVRTHVPAIESGVDKIQQEQADAKHSKILGWVSPTDYPAQQSDIIRRRQQGTGQWFLDAPEFATWLSMPECTLFCPGMPGAGKTMVAAIAIEYLLKSVQSSSVGVAYVYCNYKAQEEQDASSMLAAIVKQLVQGRPSIAEPAARLHKQHADQGTKPTLEEIFATLREVVIKYSTIYVVIDALDECRHSDGTRRLFLARLRNLQAGQDIRLMTTSRFLPDIEVEFSQAERLEVRASNEDVGRFVAGQMHRLPKCIQRNPALQKMVEEKISEMVDGMFLLARLHLDSLLDKTTAKKVKLTLANHSNGPAALYDAYKDVFQRIKSQLDGHCELAKKVLSWITCARRPLTTAELCCALAVEPGEAELDPDNLSDLEDLLSVCAGLVVVDRESAVVRLVHYTAQEYFERVLEEWNPQAQLDITLTCLTYLCFDVFKGGASFTDQDFEHRLEQNALLDYAAKYWGQHAVTVQDKVWKAACRFLLSSNLIASAVQPIAVSKIQHPGYSQSYPKQTTALHVTARFGLSRISEELLYRLGKEPIVSASATDSFGQSPLLLAARAGHTGMVELLVDAGVDVETVGTYNGNALKGASEGGYEQVVEMLIDAGADVNALSREYSSALQMAAEEGHERVVKMLLNAGADINAQSGFYGTALYAASIKGHERVVKILLEAGADANALDEDDRSALYAASEEGHHQVVKLLLEAGAELGDSSGEGVLCAASLRGHVQVVVLLLDASAGMDINDLDGGDAIYMASLEGHEQVVGLLLDAGADVSTQVGIYGDALQAAAFKGHEAIVKLLLDKGAEVNAQGGEYGNALQAASTGGHEAIVKLLLDKGAEVKAQS